MRTKVEYRSSSVTSYENFCKAYPEIKLSYKEWKRIIYTFNHMFRDYILESGDKAKLPFGIGYFSITKKKTKKFKTDPQGRTWVNLPIDWQKSKREGKRIYNLNNHTDGYRYKWKWFADTARFYMSTIWNFIPTREASRKLAEYLKKPNSKYSEIYKQWY